MLRNKYDLKGRVAVVTGGSRGMGRAIALGMAEAGADVVVASRKLPDLQEVSQKIVSMGRRSQAIAMHLRSSEDINTLVQRVVQEFGRIDILVNDAASSLMSSLLEIEEKTVDHLLDVNLKGTFLLSQASAKVMVQQKSGVIINIASGSGISPERGLGMYSVSKAGVIMLTRAMAKEWGRYNIRVNALAPGWVQTGSNEMVWSDPESLKKVESRIPLGRIAQPEEMVGVTLFLASDDAGYITGQTVLVDGGMI